MSRSYRKPATAITGAKSAKDDKRVARRNVRRRQNQYIRDSRIANDWDNFLIPHRLDCAYNDPWSWGRDGSVTLQFPPQYGGYSGNWAEWFGEEDAEEHYQEQLEYYEKLKRK